MCLWGKPNPAQGKKFKRDLKLCIIEKALLYCFEEY